MSEGPLTMEDVAERWKVSIATVKREIARRRLEFFKVGRLVRIRPSAVERYEEKFSRKAMA